MNNQEQTDFDDQPGILPRWVQIPSGLVLGLFTILTLIGSVSLVVIPNEKAPLAAPVIGILMTVACGWLLEKCTCLVLGKPRDGYLLGPRTLRVAGWCFLSMPIAGLFTGYFVTHTVDAIVQTVTYTSISAGLHRLAANREAKLCRESAVLVEKNCLRGD